MPTPDKPAAALGEKIDELENLIAGQDAEHAPVPAGGAQKIPILDEVVEPGVVDPADDPGELLLPRQVVELNQRLQARIDSELEELTEVLRGVIKRCIVDELKTQLPPAKPQAASDKPQEGSDNVQEK